MANTHYAFAEKATKLVQIVVNHEGLVQVKTRVKTNGIWPGPSVPPEPYLKPADPSVPVQFTVQVDPGSWGLFAVQMSEWTVYSPLPMFVLGSVDGASELFEDGDVDYGTGIRNPVGAMATSMMFTIDRNLISYENSAGSGILKAQIDIRQWFSQSSDNRRVCFVFRLTGNNTGGVQFSNLSGLANVKI